MFWDLLKEWLGREVIVPSLSNSCSFIVLNDPLLRRHVTYADG